MFLGEENPFVQDKKKRTRGIFLTERRLTKKKEEEEDEKQ